MCNEYNPKANKSDKNNYYIIDEKQYINDSDYPNLVRD